MSESSYLEFVKPFININLSFTKLPDLALLTFKKQISCAFELNNLVKETFIDLDFSQIDQILNQNSISKEDYEKCVSCFLTILKEYEQITIENTDEIINKVKTQSGFKGKTLFMPIRLYAIGKEHGPEMNKILPVIGKENLLNKSFKNQVKINE
jgi:glutamyl/glutaminyl-tRNA synthetase